MNKYLLVSGSALYDANRGENDYGFYISLSDDLINWSLRKLIVEARLWYTNTNDVDRVGYPSFIDPDDLSRNFEYTDREFYLYFTRWNAFTAYDRDLVRLPIRLDEFAKPIRLPGPEPFPWRMFLPVITSGIQGKK